MKKSTDLQIKIALTPSQLSFLPAMVEKMNSESEMLMDRLSIRGTTLSINCHDVLDLIEELKSKTAGDLEFFRLSRQIRDALSKSLRSEKLNARQKKNFFISSRAIEFSLGSRP